MSEADPLSDQRIGVDLVRQDAYLKGLAAGRSERAAENEALTILAGANENTMRQWEGEAARLRVENETLRAALEQAWAEAHGSHRAINRRDVDCRMHPCPQIRMTLADEQHRAWDAGAAGRRAVEKHSDALARLSDEQGTAGE